MECFALFREGRFGFDKEMIGAAMYAIPSMPATAKKYNPDTRKHETFVEKKLPPHSK